VGFQGIGDGERSAVVAKQPPLDSEVVLRDAGKDLSRLSETRDALVWNLQESRQLFFLQEVRQCTLL